MDKCESLNGKHPIFGKVTGETIYNILKANDYQVNEEDRPLFPPKIIKTQVILNPFDDIVPRKKQVQPKQEEKKKKPKKDFRLMSFGEEAQEEENEVQATQIRSSALLSSNPEVRKQAEKIVAENILKTKPQKQHIPKFVKSAHFVGAYAGYCFKQDKKGLGYYLDPVQNTTPVPPQGFEEETVLETKEKLRLKKRKVEEELRMKRSKTLTPRIRNLTFFFKNKNFWKERRTWKQINKE